jgi:hypothetical protein
MSPVVGVSTAAELPVLSDKLHCETVFSQMGSVGSFIPACVTSHLATAVCGGRHLCTTDFLLLRLGGYADTIGLCWDCSLSFEVCASDVAPDGP